MADFQQNLMTQILNDLGQSNLQSTEELLPLLYTELRSLAQSLMAGYPSGNTLQPTALVHEAYLRLEPDLKPGWGSRGHFFGSAARAMRNILVDQARRKKAAKHGGQHQRVDLDPEFIAFDTGKIDILALDMALEDLKKISERKVDVVLLRYLTGLSIAETALALQVAETTVERDWRFARLFLHERLSEIDPLFTEDDDDES